MNERERTIEAVLMYKNEPVSVAWLADYCDMSESALDTLLLSMQQHYTHRGIELVYNGREISLLTHPDCHEAIAALRLGEEEKELSKQALETLAIISYRSGVTKADIDYIRGVNSLFILRNLHIRGLIVKADNPDDRRAPLYFPSHELLAYLGVARAEELTDYAHFQKELEAISAKAADEETEL